jgi:apolipoprotein N-acyltransferase
MQRASAGRSTKMNGTKLLLPAFLSGILLSIPWLLPHAGIVMLAALVPLLLADNLNREQSTGTLLPAFRTAYVAFMIWNLLTCWWIAYVSPAGMLLITSLNALLMATVWLGKSYVQNRLGKTAGFFALTVFWVAFEFLHHQWALRWPWLTLGNSFGDSVKLIQWYEYTGVLGGSTWILLVNIFLAMAIQEFSHPGSRAKLKSSGMALLAILVPVAWSLARYDHYREKPSPCQIVVLQPNVDPFTQKFSGMSADEQTSRLIRLADSTLTKSTNLIVTPETALPDFCEDSPIGQNPGFIPVVNFLQKNPQTEWLAGAITRHKCSKSERPAGTANRSGNETCNFEQFNSSLLINPFGQVKISHKSILVSGVEQMPFQEYFSFLRKHLIDLGDASGGFTAGEPEIMETDQNVTVGPVICFESVFGTQAAALARKGAEILVVITNDGWWKKSVGIRQHFNYARIRAIETRRSIARSANTGISGFINQRGDIVLQTKPNTTTAAIASLNRNQELTFYVGHDSLIGMTCVLFSVLIVAGLSFEKRLHRIRQ